MAVDLPQLKRGLFGYRPKIVRLILTGREIMFARVWQRLARTEAELAQTRADLEASRQENQQLAERARLAEEERSRQRDKTESARAQVAELEAEIGVLRSRVQTLEAEAADDGAESSEQALSAVLESAELAFAGLVESARQRNEEQLREVDAARRELQAEMDRLAARRADLETLLSSVQETIAQARAPVQETPERLRDAPTIDATSPGVTLTVHIPEASNGSNGATAREDLAAIQEMYGSR
ncbi:MAG: hypothetical protein ACRDKA_04335 [Actinomycetota bacterium]